jgi:hypothetical protein
MAALLTSSGHPGFYFRVLEEGEVGAGDEIVKVGEAKERMTVADINALLYFPNHPHALLERALRIEPLSPRWHGSFEALLRSSTGGNAGLMPEAAAQSLEGQPLPTARPGQYIVLRLQPTPGGAPIFRSYSLSGPLSAERYRISVKIEPSGVLRDRVRVGDALDVSSRRGSFILQVAEWPVVLLSPGIGATPVLAMLHRWRWPDRLGKCSGSTRLEIANIIPLPLKSAA